MELLCMVIHTLPADVIQNPVFQLVPLKGARAAGEGRLVSLAPATARALAMYLRARRHHPLADSDWGWLGTRGRGRLQGTGIRRILVRRAEQAGYAGVTPHQFRHTFSDAWLKASIGTPMTWPTSGRWRPRGARATWCNPYPQACRRPSDEKCIARNSGDRYCGDRYWDRTSDLFGVNEVRSLR